MTAPLALWYAGPENDPTAWQIGSVIALPLGLSHANDIQVSIIHPSSYVWGCSAAQRAAEAWARYLRADDSRVGDIFVGQLKSTLRCAHCLHDSVTFDPFWDLSLPIPARTGNLKLQQCLQHFVREEELDGDEKPVLYYAVLRI